MATETDAKKKGEIHLNPAGLRSLLGKSATRFSRYAGVFFFVLVGTLYGFIVFRIGTLGNAQPQQSDIDAQVTATPVPRVDPSIAQQLQQLKDNSQNVQTLFDEARKNPFQ